jgi:hypothetical protein
VSAKRIYKTEAGATVHGVMAEFANPGDLYHAAEKVRDAGVRDWDVYSPFPVHGIEEAMGLKPTRLPLLVGVVGLVMACVGFGFQYYVRAVEYPIVHQGKPPDAWQVLIPVTFEIGVLFTAFTCILGMLVFNRLPLWHHPLLKKERFLRTSDDRFMIAIEASDPGFVPEATRELLLKAGATRVELVEE